MFGCRYEVDPRDHGYLLAESMRLEPSRVPLKKSWRIAGAALDQGQTGTCVGHGWRNFLRCAPIRTEKSGPSQWDIYRAAVLQDGFGDNDDESHLPDGDPGMDSGTTVRAGAKFLQASGRIASYGWAFNLEAAVEWLLTRGPLVMGTAWYSSMSMPDASGMVDISGEVIGRHCWLVRGADRRSRVIEPCENSWGDGWGRSGGFRLSFEAFGDLLANGGEACAAVEKKP